MNLYQKVAGFADHAVGSTDESIARQFDDTPGGGFADMAGGDFIGDVFMTKPSDKDSVHIFKDSWLGQSLAEIRAGEAGYDTGGDVNEDKIKATPAKVTADFLEWLSNNSKTVGIAVVVLAVIHVLGGLFEVQV